MVSLSTLLNILFVLQFFCYISSAKVIRPPNHPNYNDAAALAAKTVPPVTIYETTTVLVHARDNLTGHEWVATYWPRVDEFSQLELAGTFNTSLSFNPNLTIWVEYNGITTPPRRVFNETSNLIIPYFVAVVLLDKGKIRDVQYQEGCHNCRSGHCLDNNCGMSRGSGSSDVCNSTDCNIKVFLAWSGRDSSDTPCKSISSTPQNFNEFSTTPLVNFGNSVYNDFIYNWKTKAPNPFDQ